VADGFDPRGVIQGPGQVVPVTGQVSWDEHDQVVGPDDVEAQMEKAIDNVRLVLAEVGGVLDDTLSTNTESAHCCAGVLEVSTCVVVPLTKLAKGSTSAVGRYPASSRRCRGRAGPRPAC
jgi:hypothetical protein